MPVRRRISSSARAPSRAGQECCVPEPGEWRPNARRLSARPGPSRALRQYPDIWRRMMPTRLGNVLRRYEDKTGKQMGLTSFSIAPHLNLVALPEHREYVDDCRQGLDLGVRLCVLFAFATALSVVLLIRDGGWLLLALAPYASATWRTEPSRRLTRTGQRYRPWSISIASRCTSSSMFLPLQAPRSSGPAMRSFRRCCPATAKVLRLCAAEGHTSQ